ncbi:hypothetical protein [Halorhodospira halochloris]|uniref:hypothetical protein n=1 Tax=Halorhodospira halochloris TaxID=1052 RepID=UPI0013A5590F|nr:hypothetical protein [Halorhodospira halochloris]
MNPSLEASWRHPWRQDLHTGADGGAGEVLEATRGVADGPRGSLGVPGPHWVPNRLLRGRTA